MSKKTAVVGAGLSGKASLRLLRLLGQSDTVMYDDKPGVGNYSDPHELIEKFKPDTLIVSPGVPLATPWLQEFKKRGGEISSELNLAYGHLSGVEKIVGVTGSLGKSTTVALLGAGAQAFAKDSWVGGNFGFPLADYVADRLEDRHPTAPWLILELSSYQLENFARLSCEAAAITYLSSNHLERYENLEQYYSTKWSLIQKTKSKMVLNERGGDLKNYALLHPSDKLVLASRRITHLREVDFSRSQLIGTHNYDNLAVAAEVARLCQWDERHLAGMQAFRGLKHRLEKVACLNEVTFVNDSKATAMDSVRTAIHSLLGETSIVGKIWVLLGGRDKKLPWHELQEFAGRERLGFVFFGECREVVQQKSGLAGDAFAKLALAVPALKDRLGAGDAVLLSPGGTSLDEFKNFEDRGLQFSHMVQQYFGDNT